MNIIINFDNKISINIHKYSSLYHLKEIISDNINIKIHNYYLEFNGTILKENNKSLDYYKINNNSIINLHRKMKGGVDGIQILFLILCGLFIFIFIPLLLFSGLIPFILHITECMILKLFKSIEPIIESLPRFKNYIGIFRFIINILILLFKSLFLYFGLNTIFTLTYFAWTTIINGGKNLFVKTDKYCKEINTLSLMSKISTIVYLVIYYIFRLPNILVSSFGNILLFGKSIGFGSFMKLFNVPYRQLLKFTYTNKFDIFLTIPGLGEVLETLFTGIDFIFIILNEYSAKVTNLGCKVKSLGNYNTIKNKLLSTISSKLDNNKNTDVSKLKLKTNSIEKICCNEELFKVLKNDLKILIEGIKISGEEQLLKEYGVDIKLLKFLEKSFDTKYVEESRKKFKDSFFIFKFKDGNVEGMVGLLLRYIFCNIMNISKYTSDTLFKIGTPQDISDTIKCGIMSGQVSLIVYYFSLVYIPMTLAGQSTILTVVLSILVVILLYILKSQIPLLPVPLIY